MFAGSLPLGHFGRCVCPECGERCKSGLSYGQHWPNRHGGDRNSRPNPIPAELWTAECDLVMALSRLTRRPPFARTEELALGDDDAG